ncbi:MAG TPA: AsnC family transcriptional regulator [Oceanospirillaceae bacterium]|nr:AsnC family transcriptional regulator [Oceanospirillaceae bacterium]
MKYDALNHRILSILEMSGRITNAELAEQVGLSPSACLRRVQDLEREGVIQGYRTVLNKAKLGKNFVAYVMVGLNEHSKLAQQAFQTAIKQCPDVIECHNVTGSFEYMLRVETTGLDAYQNFHTDVLGVAPHVRTINTHVVMGSAKDLRA